MVTLCDYDCNNCGIRSCSAHPKYKEVICPFCFHNPCICDDEYYWENKRKPNANKEKREGTDLFSGDSYGDVVITRIKRPHKETED